LVLSKQPATLSLVIAEQVGGELGAIAEAEFGEDVVDVTSKGTFAEARKFGDPTVMQCLGTRPSTPRSRSVSGPAARRRRPPRTGRPHRPIPEQYGHRLLSLRNVAFLAIYRPMATGVPECETG
jgi:hypothetical protein